MRTLGIVFFITVSLFFAGGYFIAFRLERQEIKCQMKAAIGEGKMSELHQTFLFTLSDFAKLKENDHEFFLEKKMYDIVRTEVKGDSILVICIADHKESELLASFLNYYREQHHNNSPPTPLSNSIVHLLQNVFWQQQENSKGIFWVDFTVEIFSQQQFYSSPALAGLFHPPDYC